MKERKKNRLEKFFYNEGYFFVTINVKNHEKIFGEVVENNMILNQYGKIVDQQRLWLSKQYNYVELLDFVIMPNHLHGIINIDVGNGRDRSLQKNTKGLSSYNMSLQDHIIKNTP